MFLFDSDILILLKIISFFPEVFQVKYNLANTSYLLQQTNSFFNSYPACKKYVTKINDFINHTLAFLTACINGVMP